MSGTLWVVALWSIAIISAALSFLAWSRLTRGSRLPDAVTMEASEGDEPEETEQSEDVDDPPTEETVGT
jgi:hypothetical protein